MEIETVMDTTTKYISEKEPMIISVEEKWPFIKEDLPRVKHYIAHIILTKENVWKNWTIINRESLQNTNFNGIIFNNVNDYNSGVTFVCIDLSKSQNNTDVYVPLKGLLYGIYIIFLIDRDQTLRYKLKPDCYRDLELDLSAYLAGIVTDSIKYCSANMSSDFRLVNEQICTMALDVVKENCTFLDVFTDYYNNFIKFAPTKEVDFAILYDCAFQESITFTKRIKESQEKEDFVLKLNSANSLSSIKDIVEEFNINDGVINYITSIIDTIAHFKSTIKSIKSRQDLFIKIITTNDTLINNITQLRQKLVDNNSKLVIMYNCINNRLLSIDLYTDLQTIFSILQIVEQGAPHSTNCLLIKEDKIKTQELKNKINTLQKSPQHNEELKTLKDDAHKFCCTENIEDQQVVWFKNLAKKDNNFRVKATTKINKNLIENIKLQLYFEEHYSEYLIKYPNNLSRNNISLLKVISTFTKLQFTDHKTLRENVVEFLRNTWNVQYWQLSKTLYEYENNIYEVVYFHHVFTSNTNTELTLLPPWPITKPKSREILDESKYEILIEKLTKPLPSLSEYHYLPFIVSELSNGHFSVPYKGTIPNTLTHLWNTKLYHEYNLLQSKYDELYKANETKLSTIVNWVDSSTKKPTLGNFKNDIQQIAFEDNESFIDDDNFKEFVQNVLLTQKSDIFDDLAQLVSNHNHQKTYAIVRQMASNVYLKKSNISSQEVFDTVFARLLLEVYLKLKKYKVFEGIFDNLYKDFIKLKKEFDDYYFPLNIIGDINVKIVEIKTDNEICQINKRVFRKQSENTGIAMSAIYKYDQKLFINGLLKWINREKGDWMLSQSLPIEDFQSQLPINIKFHNIDELPPMHVVCLFFTVSFMLFSNIDIVNFIKSDELSDQDIGSRIKLLTDTLYTFIRPYFLIKEKIQTLVHFQKYISTQYDSLNIYISSIYNLDIANSNLNFPFDGNNNTLFNLFITEALKQNIQLDIKFFLNNDKDKILVQYARMLKSLNDTCISKLEKNVIFNKNRSFAYIRDKYMVYCDKLMTSSVDEEVFENLSLYKCVYIITDDYDCPEEDHIKLNPCYTSSISQESHTQDYVLIDALKKLSLCDKDDITDITMDKEQFEKEKQDLINVAQNDSLKVDPYDNVIPENSVSLQTLKDLETLQDFEDLSRPDFSDIIVLDPFTSFVTDDQLSQKDFDTDDDEAESIIQQPIDNLNPLSINDTIYNVPCVVSINNPLIDTQIVKIEKEYVPILVKNRDRNLVKHLWAISHFFK